MLSGTPSFPVQLCERGEPTLTTNSTRDQQFIDRFCAGDVEWLTSLTYDEVEEKAGHGGHEVLNWVALSGAMGGEKARLVLYEAVIEWICGMSYVDYEVAKGAEMSNGSTTNGTHANGVETNGVH